MTAPRVRPWPWRLLRGLLLGLAALLLALGQWGWEPLVAALGRLARWPPWARLEDRIARLPPRAAAAVFLAPSLLLIPVKLMALWAIERGHPAIGLLVVLLAKAAGTALVGRLFVLTEPRLVQLPWFARALGWWRATQARWHAWVAAWPPWRALRARVAAWRRLWRRWRREAGRPAG